MSTFRRGHRDERAFTLIELSIIMAIFGLLLAIAIPNIQQQIARQQVRGSAQELVSVLRNARSAAMNEGQPRYVRLGSGEPGTYHVYRYNGTAWVPAANEAPLEGSVRIFASLPSLSNAPVTGASVPANAVYFDTRGRYPTGHTGSFTITLRARIGDPLALTLYPQTGQVVAP